MIEAVDMRVLRNTSREWIGVLLTAICLSISVETLAQYPGIDDDIARHRKGTITVKAKRGDVVAIEQLRHEFWFGCAISNSFVNGSMSAEDAKQYNEKFLLNFNSAVTENALKWENMERRRGSINYTVVDSILAWCDKNRIPLRGHNLFWGIPNFVQPWLKELSDRELSEALELRAHTITSRYKGRFAEYDLNNEMIHGNYYEDRLGPEITSLMAKWAHEGDPDARLFLNDYDILTGNKLAAYMAHIRTLLGQNVPLAGIGAQGHLHAETFDRVALRSALDSLATFKLPIRVTEFNMPGQRSRYHRERTLEMTDEEEKLKAREIVDYYKICFAHPAVEGILMWGFWAGANWIPASSLYRKDWTATPAVAAYQDLIFNKWWTREIVPIGKGNSVSIRAFFGRYKVTVNGVSREVDLNKKDGKIIVDFLK